MATALMSNDPPAYKKNIGENEIINNEKATTRN
jgi:hypothetical protein